MILGRFDFSGPYTDLHQVPDRSGVYAVIALDNPMPGIHGVVDVGESGAVRTRLATHNRAPLWKRYNRRGLGVAVLYCDARTRMAVERELRVTLRPPCGER